MKILIWGAGFINKGAEAMARTVQAELAKRLPDVEFYMGRLSDYDFAPALACGMNPLFMGIDISNTNWRYFGNRIGKKLWSMTELWNVPGLKKIPQMVNPKGLVDRARDHFFERVLGMDAFLEVSGFAYSDTIGLHAFRSVRPIVNNCLRRDKAVVFLPQAWGGFDKPKTREAIRELLKDPRISFYSRDESSCRHLEKALDKPNGSIPSFPDIVFRFQGGTPEQGVQILKRMGCSLKRPIVGISPNMRVFERTSGQGTGNEYVQALVKLAKHCIETHDIDIVLQANDILDHSARMDDRYLCGMIAALVNRADRCFTTRDGLLAEETKALIGQFEFVAGSRFHSLVFAFSQGVPGMAVGWSHKYRELFSLFGMENDVQECKNIDADALIATFEPAWSQRQQRRELILEKMKQIHVQVDALFDNVAAKIRGESPI